MTERICPVCGYTISEQKAEDGLCHKDDPRGGRVMKVISTSSGGCAHYCNAIHTDKRGHLVASTLCGMVVEAHETGDAAEPCESHKLVVTWPTCRQCLKAWRKLLREAQK